MCKGYCLQSALGMAHAHGGQRWAFIRDTACTLMFATGLVFTTSLLLSTSLLLTTGLAAAQDHLFSFEIPAQPLAPALEQYGAVTGRNVLYNSNLAIGRYANRVNGTLSADAALGLLLENTGLSVQHIAGDAFALSVAASARSNTDSTDVADYFGRIQINLRTALCRSRLARPGNYRIAMRFRVDDHGIVTRYEQFGSAGSTNIDEAIHDAVSRLRIGATPPAGLGQPIVIVILPQAPGRTMGCDGIDPPPQATR